MAERHEMTLTWTGDVATATQLAELAEGHSCDLRPAEEEGLVVLTVVVVDEDLQRLRDTVDALLVSFDIIESDE
tara:strand:+ start:825 stop:1046 length:222 start_codon:yes stop_codon:yes gene_type:complete